MNSKDEEEYEEEYEGEDVQEFGPGIISLILVLLVFGPGFLVKLVEFIF